MRPLQPLAAHQSPGPWHDELSVQCPTLPASMTNRQVHEVDQPPLNSVKHYVPQNRYAASEQYAERTAHRHPGARDGYPCQPAAQIIGVDGRWFSGTILPEVPLTGATWESHRGESQPAQPRSIQRPIPGQHRFRYAATSVSPTRPPPSQRDYPVRTKRTPLGYDMSIGKQLK